MTNFIRTGMLAGICFLAFTACEDDNDISVQQPEATFEIDNAAITNLVLNSSLPDNPALTLTWKEGLSTNSYEVVMAATPDFAAPISLGTTANTQFTITVQDLNNALVDAGAAPYKTFEFYTRVNAGGNSTSAQAFTATTYAKNAPVITPPVVDNPLILDEDEADATATNLTWTDFNTIGTGVSVNYELQATLGGNDFEVARSLGTLTDAYLLNLTNESLNATALALGIAEETTGALDLRIKSTIDNGTGILERVSTPITINVTTYSTALLNLFLVGNATAPDWNNNNNNPALVRNPMNKNEFKYLGFFKGGENAFKMLEILGQWQPQWGLINGKFVRVEDPGVMNVPVDGYYTIIVNTQAQTFNAVPFNTGSAKDYTSIGIMGSARTGNGDGWNGDDTNFSRSAFDSHQWFARGVVLFDGEIKIRADDDWAESWGSKTKLSGYGNPNDNIPVTVGTYDIFFNDLDKSYILIPIL